MEGCGFLLLCGTLNLDYMLYFYNLYVLKKYNQYIFELTLESKFSSFKYSIPVILKNFIILFISSTVTMEKKKEKKTLLGQRRL